MLELAAVMGVSDAEHLRQGAVEYFNVLRDAIALAREIDPDQVPEFKLPEPQRRSLEGGGTLYSYALPDEWGVDSQIALNAGLTDTVAVLSCSPTTTKRLLQETPLDVDSKVDFQRPAAIVWHFQFAELMAAIGPWIDYGLNVATGNLKVEVAEEDEDAESDNEQSTQQAAIAMQLGFVVPSIQQFLEVASAWKSASAVMYEDGGVWVTHSEIHIEDLE
jgi:hypothetical protein